MPREEEPRAGSAEEHFQLSRGILWKGLFGKVCLVVVDMSAALSGTLFRGGKFEKAFEKKMNTRISFFFVMRKLSMSMSSWAIF